MFSEIPITIIGILWAVFLVYWLISAVGAKRTIRGKDWWRPLAIRIVLMVLLVLFFKLRSPRQFFFHLKGVPSSPMAQVAGVLLCALGLAFAIWARMHLGRNWGMPMSVRENPELVTSGPYRLVRHPIYSGALLAMLGSFLVAGRFWLFIFLVSTAYYIYSATREEKVMTQEFPDRYPEYKKGTKMLIPFVW